MTAIALITGASSGIGRATALRLAEGGYDLILVGRNRARLQEVVRMATAHGVGVTPVVADLTAEDAIEKTCNALRSEHTHLDLLVHCAGVYSPSGVLEADPDEITRLLTLNVAVPMLLTRGLADQILAARGNIVFVNSSIVFFPKAFSGLYTASRHALVGVADSLRQELRGREVGVLTVFVGATATPMQAQIIEVQKGTYDERYLLAPEDVAQAIHSAISLDRAAEVTELYVRPRRLA